MLKQSQKFNRSNINQKFETRRACLIIEIIPNQKVIPIMELDKIIKTFQVNKKDLRTIVLVGTPYLIEPFMKTGEFKSQINKHELKSSNCSLIVIQNEPISPSYTEEIPWYWPPNQKLVLNKMYQVGFLAKPHYPDEKIVKNGEWATKPTLDWIIYHSDQDLTQFKFLLEILKPKGMGLVLNINVNVNGVTSPWSQLSSERYLKVRTGQGGAIQIKQETSEIKPKTG